MTYADHTYGDEPWASLEVGLADVTLVDTPDVEASLEINTSVEASPEINTSVEAALEVSS